MGLCTSTIGMNCRVRRFKSNECFILSEEGHRISPHLGRMQRSVQRELLPTRLH